MTRFRFVVLLLMINLAFPAGAETLETGLYRVLNDGLGVLVQRQDYPPDGELRLGERVSENLSGAVIRSYDNANAIFGLELDAGTIEQGQDVGYFALVIAGRCMSVHGHSELDANGSMRVHCTVAGSTTADAIAEELGIASPRREHPGHRVRVTAAPTQTWFRVGEHVILEMRIENVGDTTFRFTDGGQQRGARNNQFSFIAFDLTNRPVPDVGDATNYGGLAMRIELEPGEVFTKQVALDNWFRFDQPDTHFSITALYEMTLLDENDNAIWADFAVARFSVGITAD